MALFVTLADDADESVGTVDRVDFERRSIGDAQTACIHQEPGLGRGLRLWQDAHGEWQVLIKEHHTGYIDWQTYDANQQRIAKNTRPGPHKVGGAVREGSALLQGLAACGHCGRRLRTHYTGRTSSPG